MANAAYDYDVIENGAGDSDDYNEAIQKAINSGVAWKFQGSAGRALMDSINAGAALLGVNPAKDYYGNYIPSRTDVEAGTKGSYEFVKRLHGRAYADYMAAL